MQTNIFSHARRWAIPLALALLPFVLFFPLALGRQSFYVHDLQHYFYPYHVVSANILRGGNLPLWNPYAFSGLPLLGDGQTAMFYPPNWLFFVLPGAVALSYAVLLQFSIAGVGMYACARHFGLGRTPAAIAALSFMFSGFLTARIVHLSIMSGAALVPLVVWLADRALARPSGRAFVGAALGAALQAVAGHPQIPVYTALGLGLLALVRAAEQRAATGRWRLFLTLPLRLLGWYVLGYAIAAVQLVPWVELGLASPRAAGATFEFVMGNGAHGADWLLFLFPFLYGQIEPGLFANVPMGIAAAVRAWEHSAYVGVLALGLAPAGLAAFVSLGARRRFGTRWYTLLWLLLLALVGAIIGAGKYTPFAGLVYATPVLGKLRDVERALVLVSFALSLLAAFGLEWLGAAEDRRTDGMHRVPTDDRPQRGPGVRGQESVFREPATFKPSNLHLADRQPAYARAVALVAAGLIVALPWFWVWFAGQRDRPTLLGVNPGDLHHLIESRPSALIPLAWACASAALLVFWALRRPGPVSLALAVALVLADMGSYAVSYQPTTDAALFERRPDVLAALDGDGQPFRKATFLTGTNELPTRAAQETLAVSWAMVYGVEDINGFNSLQPRRYTDYLFGPDVGDVSYGYLANPALLKPDNPVLAALNVRFLLVPVNMQQPPLGAHLREVYRSAEVRVYENTLAWPRAFFAGRARAEADPRAILRAVTASGFDARRETLVEGALPAGLASTPGASSAQVVRHEPNRLEIAVDTDAARLLVVSEMFFPGWSATIDGAETPIVRANYLFRAVAVPPGAHTVVFEYRPRSAQIGAAATVVGLCVGGWFALRGRRVSPARRA